MLDVMRTETAHVADRLRLGLSCRVLEELHSVRVNRDRAGPDQRAECDLIIAERIVVAPLEADATRDTHLQRRHLTEVDRLRARGHGRQLGYDVHRLAEDRVRVTGGERSLPDGRPVRGALQIPD